MTDKENAFVEEGIQRYADARHVLSRFEDIVKDRIEQIVSGKRDWTAFTKDRGKSAVKTEHVEGGKMDPRICARIKGKTTDGHKALIFTGLMWRADGPVVFARFRKPKNLALVEPHPSSPRVKSFKLKGKKTHLYVDLHDIGDLDTDLNLVLDELQRHVEVGDE